MNAIASWEKLGLLSVHFWSQANNTSVNVVVHNYPFYVVLSKICYTNNDYIYYYSFAYLFYQLQKQITCCWKKRNYGIRFVAAHIQKIVSHVAILNFEIHDHSDRITIQKLYAIVVTNVHIRQGSKSNSVFVKKIDPVMLETTITIYM